MRRDMSRKLIERGRKGGYDDGRSGYRRSRDRVQLEFDEDGNLDEVQSHRFSQSSRGPQRQMSLGRGTKSLTDKLAPLFRFLRSNVGRPWDKVYSEIRAHIGTNSTLDMHILQHLWDFVDTKNERDLSHGHFVYFGADFIVDAHGILRENEDHYRKRRLRDEKKRAEEAKRKVPNSIRLSDRSFHIKKSGIWYFVEYDNPVEEGDFRPGGAYYLDHVRARRRGEKRLVGDPRQYSVNILDPKYARSKKKQLSHRELRDAGLAND